jgi:hypothetical protein
MLVEFSDILIHNTLDIKLIYGLIFFFLFYLTQRACISKYYAVGWARFGLGSTEKIVWYYYAFDLVTNNSRGWHYYCNCILPARDAMVVGTAVGVSDN